jgi:hypothetical protein
MMAHKDTDVIVEVLIEEVSRHRFLSNSSDPFETQVFLRKQSQILEVFTTLAVALQALFPPSANEESPGIKEQFSAFVTRLKVESANSDGSKTELTEACEPVQEAEPVAVG